MLILFSLKIPTHEGWGRLCTKADSALTWSSTPRVPPNQRCKDREKINSLQGFLQKFCGAKRYLKLV